MAEEQDLPEYIKKMDATAEKLLALVNDEKTSDTQRGRLFAQLLSYYKLRKTLIPSDEGNGLQEMANGLKSQGGGGTRTAGSTKSGAGRDSGGSKDGKAIRALIRALPSHSRRAGGDPEGAERPSGSPAGDGGGVSADGGGDVGGDVDGARRIA